MLRKPLPPSPVSCSSESPAEMLSIIIFTFLLACSFIVDRMWIALHCHISVNMLMLPETETERVDLTPALLLALLQVDD